MIDSTYLTPATTYTFSVTVVNFIGDTSAPVSVTVTTDSIPVPTVNCRGSCSVSSRASLPVTLQGSVQASPCALTANNRLAFLWGITPAVSGLNMSAATQSFLYIRSFLLTPDTTYTVNFTAYMTANAALAASAVFTITVPASQLRAVVDSQSIYQGASVPIVLSGAQSIDIDTLSQAGLSYAWTCATVDGVVCTDLTTGLPLVLAANATVTVPAGTLDVGSYVFRLTVTKGGSSATATVAVTLVLEAPPVVSVTGVPTIVTSGERVVLRCSADRGNANITWVINSVNNVTAGMDLTRPVLLLNQNFQTGFFVPGDVITGQCFASVIGAPRGQSSFSFTVHSNPAGGSVTASPGAVVVLTGDLTLTTNGWAAFDTATIVSYQFWYRGANGATVPLGARQPANSVTTSNLPSNTPAVNSTLLVGVTVVDSLGGSASASVNITILPAAALASTTALTDLLASKISAASDSGSTDAVRAVMRSVGVDE